MNKETERFYLDKFKENFPGFPKGTVCPDERPDFLVKTEQGVVGIEITEFFRDMADAIQSPLQQREAVRRKIMEQANAFADKRGFLVAYVFVHFDLNFNCKASEISIIASKLVEVAEGRFQIGQNDEYIRRHEIQIPGIAALSLKRTRGSTSIWRAPLGSFVPTMNPQQIQDILDQKNCRCDEYGKKCDEIWLVIVMDRFRASSFALIPEGVANSVYAHRFDSAFLFFYDYDATQKPPLLLKNLSDAVSEIASARIEK